MNFYYMHLVWFDWRFVNYDVDRATIMVMSQINIPSLAIALYSLALVRLVCCSPHHSMLNYMSFAVYWGTFDFECLFLNTEIWLGISIEWLPFEMWNAHSLPDKQTFIQSYHCEKKNVLRNKSNKNTCLHSCAWWNIA